jgi:hypothetical protein
LFGGPPGRILGWGSVAQKLASGVLAEGKESLTLATLTACFYEKIITPGS